MQTHVRCPFRFGFYVFQFPFSHSRPSLLFLNGPWSFVTSDPLMSTIKTGRESLIFKSRFRACCALILLLSFAFDCKADLAVYDAYKLQDVVVQNTDKPFIMQCRPFLRFQERGVARRLAHFLCAMNLLGPKASTIVAEGQFVKFFLLVIVICAIQCSVAHTVLQQMLFLALKLSSNNPSFGCSWRFPLASTSTLPTANWKDLQHDCRWSSRGSVRHADNVDTV